jgi:alkanesulfonate monooxygenase SsuD/methylene tetrahydromethanopterin reductase-like flavin-dependent oxidoreductase (luciferase family)
MLRVTGRLADGWLPSLGDHLSPEDARRGHEAIDRAAEAAGRRPDDVVRAVNVTAAGTGSGPLVDQLARIVEDLGFSTLVVGVPPDDPIGFVRRLGDKVAPAVRARFD